MKVLQKTLQRKLSPSLCMIIWLSCICVYTISVYLLSSTPGIAPQPEFPSAVEDFAGKLNVPQDFPKNEWQQFLNAVDAAVFFNGTKRSLEYLTADEGESQKKLVHPLLAAFRKSYPQVYCYQEHIDSLWLCMIKPVSMGSTFKARLHKYIKTVERICYTYMDVNGGDKQVCVPVDLKVLDYTKNLKELDSFN